MGVKRGSSSALSVSESPFRVLRGGDFRLEEAGLSTKNDNLWEQYKDCEEFLLSAAVKYFFQDLKHQVTRQ